MHLAVFSSLVNLVNASILRMMNAMIWSYNLNGIDFRQKFNECYHWSWAMHRNQLRSNVSEALIVIVKHSNVLVFYQILRLTRFSNTFEFVCAYFRSSNRHIHILQFSGNSMIESIEKNIFFPSPIVCTVHFNYSWCVFFIHSTLGKIDVLSFNWTNKTIVRQ